jgi:hypothetical protein
MGRAEVTAQRRNPETKEIIETKTLKAEAIDPVRSIFTPGDGPHCALAMTVGTQRNFGEFSIKAAVQLECDQTTDMMDKAAELAFIKALEYINGGMQIAIQQGMVQG